MTAATRSDARVRSGLRGLARWETLLFVALVGLILMGNALSPFFLTPQNFSNLLSALMEVAIMAIPMTMIIILGEIDLSAGVTANVTADLKVGSLEETVTVTGATPIVDVQSARTQNVMKSETLDNLPSGSRNLMAFAAMTLGAMPSSGGRNDVGGDKGEQAAVDGAQLHDTPKPRSMR